MLLAGCPDEQPPPTPPPIVLHDEAVSAVVTASVVSVTAVPLPSPSASPSVPSSCPAWVRLARCVSGDKVMASASVGHVKNDSLARAAAENRARAALLGKKDGVLRGAAIVTTVTCDGMTWVLASAEKTAEPLPACDAARLP